MEQKILQYEGPVRNEEIVLKVASYAYGNQLFVGMMRPGEEEESYGDLTINLPYEDVERNEAFISDLNWKYKIKFIRKYKLGRVRRRVGHSGYCTYRLVQFNLKKLFLEGYSKNAIADAFECLPETVTARIKRAEEDMNGT